MGERLKTERLAEARLVLEQALVPLEELVLLLEQGLLDEAAASVYRLDAVVEYSERGHQRFVSERRYLLQVHLLRLHERFEQHLQFLPGISQDTYQHQGPGHGHADPHWKVRSS
jgi:hypothetical protein